MVQNLITDAFQIKNNNKIIIIGNDEMKRWNDEAE